METGPSLTTTVSFFVIAFAVSWLLWLPQVLDSNGWVQFPEYHKVDLTGQIFWRILSGSSAPDAADLRPFPRTVDR
jgi:hypothetical protein